MDFRVQEKVSEQGEIIVVRFGFLLLFIRRADVKKDLNQTIRVVAILPACAKSELCEIL